MSFTINKKLGFINSFQFLIFSIDSLVKSLDKGDFKNLSRKFDNNVLDLVKRKEFYPDHVSDFENSKEELRRKQKLYRSLTDRKITAK